MAKLDLDAKEAAQKRAQEQLSTARQAVNEKHRELLKTSTSDPLKVTPRPSGRVIPYV